MTVLSKSFFALVSSHLVAFAFLSVRHNSKCLLIEKMINIMIDVLFSETSLHLLHKDLGGLEGRDLVLRDDDHGVLADVAGGLL